MRVEFFESSGGARGQIVNEWSNVQRRGWYFLDEVRGMWEGPFKTKEDAEWAAGHPPWEMGF